MPSSRLFIGGGLVAAAALAARPRLRSWGATREEQTRPLPGDWMIPGETGITTMATTIAAPASAVWPWLAQMGYDRAGWYSWDHLDRGGIPSGREIVHGWQHVEQGDRFYSLPDHRAWFEVAHVQTGRSLVLRSFMDAAGHPLDPAAPRPRWFNDARWEFFLDAREDGTTRLLVRSGGVGKPAGVTALLNAVFWQPAHVVMQVRQLGEIRRRAERLAGDFAVGELRHEVAAGVR